jgi:hypothetical protein
MKLEKNVNEDYSTLVASESYLAGELTDPTEPDNIKNLIE